MDQRNAAVSVPRLFVFYSACFRPPVAAAAAARNRRIQRQRSTMVGFNFVFCGFCFLSPSRCWCFFSAVLRFSSCRLFRLCRRFVGKTFVHQNVRGFMLLACPVERQTGGKEYFAWNQVIRAEGLLGFLAPAGVGAHRYPSCVDCVPLLEEVIPNGTKNALCRTAGFSHTRERTAVDRRNVRPRLLCPSMLSCDVSTDLVSSGHKVFIARGDGGNGTRSRAGE